MQLQCQQLEQGRDHAIFQVFLVHKEVLSPGKAPELGSGGQALVSAGGGRARSTQH